MEHHSNIVPVAAASARAPARTLRGGADRRPRRADPRGVRAAADAADEASPPITHMSNALGTINPVRDDRRAGARARRARCWSTASQAAYHMPVDVQALGLRLLRRHRPQAVRPDRHRRALRPGSAPRGDAAVPGRRRHDPLGHVREEHLERAAVQVRGGHAGHRRRDRARARRSTTSRRSASTPIGAHERDLLAYGTAVLEAIDGVRLIGTARAQGEHPVVRHGRRAPARHRHDRRSRGRRDPHRPSLRAAGDGAVRRSGDGARVARDVQHARGDRRARPGALRKVREVFA